MPEIPETLRAYLLLVAYITLLLLWVLSGILLARSLFRKKPETKTTESSSDGKTQSSE